MYYTDMDPHLLAIIKRITQDLQYGEVDGDLFALNLEREWRPRIMQVRDLFGEVPHVLRRELEQEDRDLDLVQSWCADHENWEWCAAVRDFRAWMWRDSGK